MKCITLIKWRKRENLMGKTLPQKERRKQDAWMDGVLKTPQELHTSCIYKELSPHKKDSWRHDIPPIMSNLLQGW
ncbi:hypothetical protein CIAN88_23835 [[Clostridium] innocuum]|uniref:Uncharacterized protein n=2 Tax=Clostridium innocuum TaxID=1522 RepID=A0A099I294_CLOIN|nr:hypothetical protein CIAN88_23835 [[Clostridium] innocuum]